MTLDERLVQVVPTARQIAHQSTEFYGFVHFGMNTFTDREWGDGRESPEIFNPYAFDADQWVAAIKSAGMKGLILTCKHHDGFCLWDSKLTEHCVTSSPYKKDVVRQVADTCKRGGIKFGVYLSPWDMNSPLYGQGKPYDDYFVGQLRELLTGYGEVFSVWFDGACGEGPNGKKQYYDWERYYATIRELQPNACISVCGEDVRWCGNEAGYTRPAEWSVVPKRTKDTEKVASLSQQSDSEEFRKRKIAAWDQDLGSREILKDEPELIWYPAEVNTSIRPGWFWHESENDRSHLEHDRRERDEKVAKICDEAGIPIIKLWTSYGIRPDYIRKRISEQLAALPAERVHRFEKQVEDSHAETPPESAEKSKKKGCYIATAVYGSYDCPEVRVLRRYRDESLGASPFGRAFIRIYYAISPAAVRIFGRGKLFNRFWKSVLDRLVARLKSEGFEDGEYTDL